MLQNNKAVSDIKNRLNTQREKNNGFSENLNDGDDTP